MCCDAVKSLTQIRRQLQVMDKRATERLEPQYLAFLEYFTWMHMNRIVFSEFQLNPYWNALIEIIGYFSI